MAEDGHLSLSTTAVVEAMQCLARFNYHRNLHLVSKPVNVSVALRRGIWIHSCLEAIHRGRGYGRLLTDLADWATDHGVPQEQVDKVQIEVTHIVDGYVKYWAERERYPLNPVAVEEQLRLPLPNGDELTCTVDTIVEENGQLAILEHKSTSRFPDADWRAIDPQTALQYAICRLSGKYPVEKIIFNYLSTKEPPVPRVKKDGSGFYATEITTTSYAFNAGVQALSEAGYYRPGEFEEYVAAQRAKMVNDAAFYHREVVYKPDALVLTVLRNVKYFMDLIRMGHRSGIWPHSVNMLRCPRCPYAQVCPVEMLKGGVAEGLRREYLQIENDDSRREGRPNYDDAT